MPRGPRLDAPGTLHHVMVRGIEGNLIVSDDHDRTEFVSRLGRAASSTSTIIYAWALMTNHAHFLLKSGNVGLSTFMRKLMTGYAVSFNRRHKRHGHLFQNRYKSIVCDEEPYFLKLVSYIHLNPLRAGLVSSLEELNGYPWCGHAVLLNRQEYAWQDRDYVLRYFAELDGAAQLAYLDFVEAQGELGRQSELTGGGLIRSAGGWSEVLSMKRRGEQQFSDERILGGGDFVKELLDEAEESVKSMVPVFLKSETATKVLESRCSGSGLSLNVLRSGCKLPQYVKLRSELVLCFVRDLGLSYAATARLLGVSASSVNQILRRFG
jgi:REP element-mobilizing transposase RayT